MSFKDKLLELYYILSGKTFIGKSEPIYEKPDITLFGKALYHEDIINRKCIDHETGLLLYKNINICVYNSKLMPLYIDFFY